MSEKIDSTFSVAIPDFNLEDMLFEDVRLPAMIIVSGVQQLMGVSIVELMLFSKAILKK